MPNYLHPLCIWVRAPLCFLSASPVPLCVFVPLLPCESLWDLAVSEFCFASVCFRPFPVKGFWLFARALFVFVDLLGLIPGFDPCLHGCPKPSSHCCCHPESWESRVDTFFLCVFPMPYQAKQDRNKWKYYCYKSLADWCSQLSICFSVYSIMHAWLSMTNECSCLTIITKGYGAWCDMMSVCVYNVLYKYIRLGPQVLLHKFYTISWNDNDYRHSALIWRNPSIDPMGKHSSTFLASSSHWDFLFRAGFNS